MKCPSANIVYQSPELIGFERSEIELLQKIVAKELPKIQAKHDKLKDIQEIGEASSKQCDKLIDLEIKLEIIKSFLSI